MCAIPERKVAHSKGFLGNHAAARVFVWSILKRTLVPKVRRFLSDALNGQQQTFWECPRQWFVAPRIFFSKARLAQLTDRHRTVEWRTRAHLRRRATQEEEILCTGSKLCSLQDPCYILNAVQELTGPKTKIVATAFATLLQLYILPFSKDLNMSDQQLKSRLLRGQPLAFRLSRCPAKNASQLPESWLLSSKDRAICWQHIHALR